jgi:hypothetical protein
MTCPWYPPATYKPAAGTGQLLVSPPFSTTTSPMFPLTTTLNRIKACNPCDDHWQAGLQAAGKAEPDDEPISYEAILDAVGIGNALWCCQAEKQHANLWRRYAVWCARQVQHLMTDERRIAALDVAERHANGEATDSELAAAWAAAKAAAWDAAWAAAWAARDAARDAARAAAWDAQSAAFRQLVTTGTLPAVEQRQEVAA